MRDLQTLFPAKDASIWASPPGGSSPAAARDEPAPAAEAKTRPFAQVMADLRRGAQELQERRHADGGSSSASGTSAARRNETGPEDTAAEPEDPLESAEQGWVEVPLSARMAVITTSEESDDETALAEFARTQGFDEMALAAIFGSAGVQPATLIDPTLSVSALPLTVAPDTTAGMVSIAGTPAGVSGLLPESAVIEHLAAAQAAAGQLPASAGAVAASPAAAAVPPGAAAAGSPGSALNLSVGLAAGTAALQTAGTSSNEVTTPAASLVIAFTAAASAQALAARTAAASVVPATREGVASPGASPLQVTITSVGTSSASGAASSGNTGGSPSGSGGSGGSGGFDSMSTLARLGWTALVRDAAEPKAAGSGKADISGLPDVAALGANATSVLPHELAVARSTSELSTANPAGRVQEWIQAGEPPARDPAAWADKLAQTMGQRLAAQIAKGHWSVRLSLNPQHLGHIDVDLSLRGKDVEAAFQVSNAQTRVLLQDSLPRLKDSLNSSGMDVASLNVSGGWADRDRGNPTPWQKSAPDQGGSTQTETSRGLASDAPAPDTTASARPHSGRGVLDVLV